MNKKFKEKFDIVFLSYDEPYAEEHWQRLKKRFPAAQRVHGVKGILNAHKECACLAKTDYFFVVDGDAYILDEFNFRSGLPSRLQSDCLYIFGSRNPINDLVYGNGGVKLFPKSTFDGVEDSGVDVTLTILPKYMPIETVSSITRFNASPFDTWKAGFRECVNLGSLKWSCHKDQGRVYLLNVWCNKGWNRPFGKWCIKGARAGRRYGMENIKNEKALKLMNDYDWLRKHFYYELKKGYLKGMESELDKNMRP